MKKIICILVALMLVSLCACGSTPASEQATTEEPTTEAPMTDIEICAEYAVSKLKDCLKNPSSLSVNHLYGIEAEKYESGKAGYYYAIDYSAENGFGGSNRDTFYIHVEKIEDGFAVKTYGASSVSDSTNQMYTKTFYTSAAFRGYYEFDPVTYRISTLWK